MEGRKDGWKDGKAGLRIAYSNQKWDGGRHGLEKKHLHGDQLAQVRIPSTLNLLSSPKKQSLMI